MTQIQSNKQDIGSIEKKLKPIVEEYRSSSELPPKNITSRWNNDEVLLAIQGNC